jgi:histidyl-tRNA synthetase
MKYTVQRGTKDILPSETPIWQALEKTCQRLFDLYNYEEIRTPIFEQTELFTRSIGDTTDIVSKEMYTFQDRKGRSLTLRPEETAPVVRACLQNNLIGKDKITKLYYFGPMFRYERPQAGRQRQFHQAGVEVFGSADPLLDVEVIILAEQIFNRLGLRDLEVDINSVGCKDCRPKYIKKLNAYFKDNIKDMCGDCKKRLQVNTLRILDCKEKGCQEYIQNAPASLDTLCQECKDHFKQVIDELKALKINYKINNRLVRGLDYYTRTTFEIVSKELGAQNAVCGGGRYDDLVKDLGGPDLPAIGFAIGLERVIELLRGRDLRVKAVTIYIATLGDAARKLGFNMLTKVRKAGFTADIDYLSRSLKAQMKAADREGAKYVYILGEDEVKKGSAVLKNMETGKQEEVKCDARILVDLLLKKK